MSRIEEALKKIARQRQSDMGLSHNLPEAVVDQPYPRGHSEREQMNTLLDVEPLKVNNLLLATSRDEKSALVEEFNKLRSLVISLTKGDTFLNTLLVTSTTSEEGKSLTALNLAIALAKESDHTVLLVDSDLRRPSIHKYLGLDPQAGLVHCLRNKLSLEQVLIKTGIGKLVVLPAGDSVDDPVDLLSSHRMREILFELKNRYAERYVIFDSPPALPFADAGILAGVVDSTLLVVREGKSNEADVKKMLEVFTEHHLLGVVYNDAHSFLKPNRYYYY